jgi:fructose-bisphosphate aldolase class II
MHGSSSVPQEWLAIIRQYGGDMKETYGVPVEEIVEGIKHGVRKVNIDTDIRLAMTGAMRKAMADKPEEFDPRAFLKRRWRRATSAANASKPSAAPAGSRSSRSRWRKWPPATADQRVFLRHFLVVSGPEVWGRFWRSP